MASHAKAAGHAIHQQLIVFPLGLLATAVVFDILRSVIGHTGFAVASYYMSELACCPGWSPVTSHDGPAGRGGRRLADVATAWISGAFALAGAFGTFVATSTRQRNIRWDERRFLIYSDFLDQLNAAAKAMSDGALAEAGEEPVPGRDPAFHKRARSYAWDKLHPLRRQVELVASKEAESTAGEAFDALLTLDELRSGGKSPDDADWNEVYQGFNRARSGFIRAVRHELAIVITRPWQRVSGRSSLETR